MKSASQAKDSPPAAALPLFFNSPQVIHVDVHAKAKLRGGLTMEFARNTNSVPLTITDLLEASMCYPIVFTNDALAAPMAIVGLENENYFVDVDGKWKEGAYVPAYVRRYPFLFGETEGSDQLTLCIEESALEWNVDAPGTPLYDGTTPTTFVNNALEFCAAYHEQHKRTRELSEALLKWDILKPSVSNIILHNGRHIVLNGFQMIDMEKLHVMKDADVLEGFKNEMLSAVFCAMQSQTHWRQLLEMGSSREPS